MKTLLALLGSALLALGQGAVGFYNTPTTLITTNGGAGTGLTGTSPNSFYYALFLAPSTVTAVAGNSNSQAGGYSTRYAFNDASWMFSGNQAINTGIAGRLNGGDVLLPGHAAGTTVSLVVIGWSANMGSSLAAFQSLMNDPNNWDSANNLLVSGVYGQSAVGYAVAGTVPSTSIFGTTPGKIPGFVLGAGPIPEPSAVSLVGLGALALLVNRRRK